MPSKSKAQQSLFGMIHAYQKGELKHPSEKIKHMAKTISATDVKHFAETKTKGLPEHVKEAFERGIEKAARSWGEYGKYIMPNAQGLRAAVKPTLKGLAATGTGTIGALGGTALGAGAGALHGAFGEKDENDSRLAKVLRETGIGALGGGIVGGAAGVGAAKGIGYIGKHLGDDIGGIHGAPQRAAALVADRNAAIEASRLQEEALQAQHLVNHNEALPQEMRDVTQGRVNPTSIYDRNRDPRAYKMAFERGFKKRSEELEHERGNSTLGKTLAIGAGAGIAGAGVGLAWKNREKIKPIVSDYVAKGKSMAEQAAAKAKSLFGKIK